MKEFQDNIKTFSLEAAEKILSEIVAVNTTQPEGNETTLVKLLEARYRDAPVECYRLNHTHNRSSLIIRLNGKSKEPAIAFIGHLDTVLCGDKSKWNTDPLLPVVQDGRLYARGSADMKGGIAAMLLTLDHLLSEKLLLKKSVLFCFTADEESKGLGAQALLESGILESTKALIICEPSRNSIGLSEKGALWLQLTASGIASHASRPELGCNSIEGLITFAQKALQILDCKIEHPYLEKNTLSITKFSGGVSTNIIPANAALEMDIRTLPGTSHEELLNQYLQIISEMEKTHSPLKISLKVVNNRPPLETGATEELVLNLQKSAKARGIELTKRGLFFYTDASQLVPQLQIPFVILGPGDDREAHKPNESIALACITQFAALYAGFICDHYS